MRQKPGTLLNQQVQTHDTEEDHDTTVDHLQRLLKLPQGTNDLHMSLLLMPIEPSTGHLHILLLPFPVNEKHHCQQRRGGHSRQASSLDYDHYHNTIKVTSDTCHSREKRCKEIKRKEASNQSCSQMQGNTAELAKRYVPKLKQPLPSQLHTTRMIFMHEMCSGELNS